MPLPKDSSDFTVKPPPGAVIVNPPLDRPLWIPRRAEPSQPEILPDFSINPQFSKPSTEDSLKPRIFLSLDLALKAADQWKLRNAPISKVLSQIQRTHNVQILVCSPPEHTFEDAKISMKLKGKTAEEKLGNLAVIGLTWRKIDDVYYVAWSEKELPITPASRRPTSPVK